LHQLTPLRDKYPSTDYLLLVDFHHEADSHSQKGLMSGKVSLKLNFSVSAPCRSYLGY
jgi:hypothetical protein